MRHLLQILIMTIAGGAMFFALTAFVLPPPSDVVWIETILAQKRWREELMPDEGRRIIVLGGSEAHFSISAEQIERETGVPAINFATHAGLRVDGHLALIEPYLQSNDILVYCVNYFQSNDLESTSIKSMFMRRNMPTYFLSRPVTTWPDYIGYNVFDQVLRAAPSQRARDMALTLGVRLNGHGDENRFADGRKREDMGVSGKLLPYVEDTPAMIRELATFERRWRGRGVQTLIYWAPLSEEPAYLTREERLKANRIAAHARAWKLIELNRPLETLLEPEEVADTPLHANPKGRERYTSILIERLEPYL